MDDSETYIKMCEKATEIQEGKPQDGVGGRWLTGSIIVNDGFQDERGDFYHIVDTNEERTCTSCGNTETYIKCTKSTWLPRQDQLQAMMMPKPYFNIQNLLSFFFDYWIDWNDDEGEFTRYTSMEQFWLAFVMEEKYRKHWDGEGWVLQKPLK